MSTVRMVGHYEIRELLGEGGIGQVHAARDTMLEREVAIKSLRPELVNDKSFVDRFRSEANNLAKLTHPNITTLYSLLPEGGNLYMVMELVRGRTLEDILKERNAPFSTQEALAIIGQAADGLSFAHSLGIVHRDIKPANMMITGAGMLKIMDFGIARVQGSQRMTRAGSAFGTPEYMSPEQVKGQDVDVRSDLYSLAIVLYEMLTGAVPFSANTDYELGQLHINTTPERPSRRISGLDPVVEKALMRALAKKADDRYESVAAFKAALGATAPASDAANIVRKATRLVGFPTSLNVPPAVATAVSSVSSAVTERVDKSSIPFALRGVAIGAGAALVAAAAIVLFTRSPSPPPVVQAPPPVVPATNTQPQTATPCGVQGNGMFYKPCPPGTTTVATPQRGSSGNTQLLTAPSAPSGGAQKKPPFEGAVGTQVAVPAAQQSSPPVNPPASNAAPTNQPSAPAQVAVRTPDSPTAAPATTNLGAPSGVTPPSTAPSSAASLSASPPSAPTSSSPPPSAAPSSAAPSTNAPTAPADSGGTPAPAAGDATQGSGAGSPSAPPAPRSTEREAIAAYEAKNYPAARELAEPCAQDSAECQFILARLHELGQAVPKDLGIAADWYRKAAAGGLARARTNLGYMFYTGNGVLKDLRTAAEWFHKAAMQGHAQAQFNLASMYEEGEGVPRDLDEARKWYTEVTKSSDAGLAGEARDALAKLVTTGPRVASNPRDGRSRTPPPKEGATALARSSATDAGSPPPPPGNIARQTEKEAVAAYEAKNYPSARELAEPCAKDNGTECQFIMARLHELGQAVPKDLSLAAEWYRKAAAAGHARSRTNLGFMYYSGNGVLKDLKAAGEWFQKAAAQGHAQAQFNLASMYEEGEGVPRDLGEARKWYTEVTKSSDAALAEEAREALDRIGKSRRRR